MGQMYYMPGLSIPELLIKMRNVSKNSLIEAMEACVFFRVVHSVSDIDNQIKNVSYELVL
jgi:hypothetical protein